MPQVVAAMLIGAGLAAGLKWLTKELTRDSEPTRLATEENERRAGKASARTPKDLGSLVWDAKSGVYRPSAGHHG